MLQRHTRPQNSARYQQKPVPKGTFIVKRDGKAIDLTQELDDGAKLTVLYVKFAKALGIPTKIPSSRKKDRLNPFTKYYDFLRRALDRFVDKGLATRQTGVINTCSADPDERKGVFYRASEAARVKTPNLIDKLQNSKCFANDSDLSETTPGPAIPGRCGFLRQQAIKRLSEIDNYKVFVRDAKTHDLNPDLVKKLGQVDNLFNAWDEETRQKVIVLRNLRSGEYIPKPYKTRFNNEPRKLYNIKVYNTGIDNSLAKWKIGVFLTLTTDPLIWMSPKGEKFTRHINDPETGKPDPKTGKPYVFEGVGRGSNEYEANRHESTAWRKWYEKICHRFHRRIPYIRCVEYQENGLIHTHVLLFDVDWNIPWYDFAKEWGTDYGQGYLNKSYQVINDGTKWTWQKHRPEDTEGRAPADYLKKYLIKSMYETSGFYMYWATNKRFFTMSETVRYLSYDEKIAEEDWKKSHPVTDAFDYVGAPHYSLIPEAIESYLKRKYGKDPVRSKDDGKPLQARPQPVDFVYIPAPENLEDPDEIDDVQSPTDYEILIQREKEWAEEKRRRLAKKAAVEREIFQTQACDRGKSLK